MDKTKLTNAIKSVKVALTKHSPEILTGLGIAGMVTTTVLAVKATPKALRLIEEAEREKYEETNTRNDSTSREKLTTVETVKAAWKPYIPAVITGTVSIGCLIGASSVNSRRNTALAAAYQLSEKALSEYKEKVIETIGEKKEKHIRDEIAKDRIEKNPVDKSTVIISDKGNTLCYDLHSDRYFRSDIDKIKRAVNELNYRMTCGMEMSISLNEFYDEIGLPHTKIGDDMGWNVTVGMIDVHYGSQLTPDEQPCIVIEHLNPPIYDYDGLY